jgi:hypothetical protein
MEYGSIDVGHLVTLTTGMSVRPKAKEDSDFSLTYTQPAASDSDKVPDQAPKSDKVGRCRLTVSKPALKTPMF